MRPNTKVSTARNSTTPVSYTHLDVYKRQGNLSVTDRDYETELDAAATSIDRLVRDLSDNRFVSEEDKKSVAQYVSIVRKEIAWARVDMRKLRYGDE